MDNGVQMNADFSGLPPGGRVVIGFSGGADSMALTHCAAACVDRDRILCVHINHMLRGQEAERDENACKAFCGEQGLEIAVYHEAVTDFAKKNRLGEEEAGRVLRYRRFAECAPDEDDRILTAHNADDSAETILMNMARGSGLAGLCGIPRSRGKILRPLLSVTRDQIEEYCRANSLRYVQDSSNASDKYTRNKVRHEIMPVFKEINPGFVRSMENMAEQVALCRDFIDTEAKRLLEEAATPRGILTLPLKRAHLSVRMAAIRLYFEQRGNKNISSVHIEQVAEHLENGSRITLSGGFTAVCSCDVLLVAKQERHEEWRIKAEKGVNLLPTGKELKITEMKMEKFLQQSKINKLLFNYVLDCDTMTQSIYAGNRRPGDRFAPAGRGVTKTLKQLLMDESIPLGFRDELVLLEMGGKIVFVEAVGAAEGFQATEKTRSVLTVEINS